MAAAAAIPMPLLLLHLLLLSPPPPLAAAAAVDDAVCDRRVAEILRRLADLVDFYATDPERINADGYFGLRLSRDLLAAAGRTRDRRLVAAPCDRLLKSVLARQGLLIERFKRSLPGRSRYDVVTYERICEPFARRLQPLTGGGDGDGYGESAEAPPLPRLPLHGPPLAGAGDNLSGTIGLVKLVVNYDESKGDACLVEILRPEDEICSQQNRCQYFDQPLKQASGYFLTHQLLYRLSDALKTCALSAASRQKPGAIIPDDFAAICDKIFGEFKQIEALNWTKIAMETDGDIVTGLRDLYMEQAFLCGLVGGWDFYHRVSMDTVASWQDPEFGCFKLFGSGDASVGTGRKILKDSEMLGGCSAHSSGLAMGFYSNTIRYLISAAEPDHSYY